MRHPPCCRCQGEDTDLAAALAASLEGETRGGQSAPWGLAGEAAAADEEADLAAAIAASLADQHGGSAGPVQQGQQGVASPCSVAALRSDDDDPELAAATAALCGQQQQTAQQQTAAQQQGGEAQTMAAVAVQLPDLPPEPAAGAVGAVDVAVRLPGGRRVSRRFDCATHTVGHLAAFAAAQGADVAACQLALQFPRRVLNDLGQSLEAAGVGDKQLVALEPK